MNCIQSVIMPMNHSCFTTVYQSFYTTIDTYEIHNKLQFFLQTLVILVAVFNSILHATQNKTFLENGNNRIKHCVKPMKWQDRVCLDFVLKQYYVYHMQFALECAKTDLCVIARFQFLFVTICKNDSISIASL